jgi:hypothetical protein
MLPGGLRRPDRRGAARSAGWTRLPLVPVRNARIAALAAFIAGSAAVIWVLWGPMLSHAGGGGSLRRCLKDFYAPDQYAVLGIARLAQDGMSVYQEPYTATGTSVYPSEYYRLLGFTADATDTTVIWAWNVVGLVVSLALIAVAVAFALRLAPGTRAWILAPAPFLLGTLYWWGTGGWLYAWNRGIIWPPVASLYSPGAEAPAVLTAGLALILLVMALGAQGRRALALAAGGGAAAGVTLHLHANVVVFVVIAVALMMLWDVILHSTARRSAIITAGAVALLLAASLAPAGGVATRMGLLLAGVAAAALTDARWRRERGRVVAVWSAGLVLASLPLSVRLASQTLGGEGYFYERQDSVAAAALDLPVTAVLGLMLPLWALSAAVTVHLARARDRATPGWAPLVAGLASATLLLTLAGRLGAEGLEWHRFLIYGGVLTTMAAMPGLWLMLSGPARASRGAGIAVGALLVATLPATLAFAADQRGLVACTPPQEAEAFTEIGRLAGDRILLLDSCFPPGPIRVLSGARIVHFNAGIALPEDRAGTDAALATIQKRGLPDPILLQRAGATGFLTNNLCGGVRPEEIAARLGTPYARIPLRDAEQLGLPGPLTYELYDIPPLG